MSSDIKTSEPKLDKPGAGLPFFEWAVAKYILLPRLFKNTNKEKAIDFFIVESKKITNLCSKLNPEMLSQRHLIPRLQGLEDSSRYWSVAMTLEHLVIVGDLTRELIVNLSKGNTEVKTLGIADVKPDPNIDAASMLPKFEQMSQRFVQETSAVDVYAFPEVTHRHPWFGEQNASRWLIFAGPHQRIHRKQIEAIISRLS